jgi:hypothetical protein
VCHNSRYLSLRTMCTHAPSMRALVRETIWWCCLLPVQDKYGKDGVSRPHKKGRSDSQYGARDAVGPPWAGPNMQHSMSYG